MSDFETLPVGTLEAIRNLNNSHQVWVWGGQSEDQLKAIDARIRLLVELVKPES